MRVLRKIIAFVVYAALLLPVSEHRLTAWMKVVEVTSTALDRTMRRRRSRLENDHCSRFMRLLQLASDDREEKTLRIRCATMSRG